MSSSDDETYAIIGCAMRVHNALGPGLREKPYENALVIDLRMNGFDPDAQRGYPIRYLDFVVGDCVPDITVNGRILVEVKSVEGLGDGELSQMLNYLRISELKIGLIINFRNSKIEWRRVVGGNAEAEK
ncbi:MAG: GxxExxY protein [Verrucomicrobiales bacterium]|jgi:GxxExxY protein|nr:GxxExxY protein [bacterium]MDF2377370.1 GxxExxY protein [Verrucomicrobiales bacterium]